MNTVIRHLRRAVFLQRVEGLSDSQLLEAFVSRQEEAAFEALLGRHGPMVLGVCRRILGNVHDAEDAFQATFLVLARKADALRSRELLGNWLYGVAYRTAMKAQAMNAKRRMKERRAGAMPRTSSAPDEELLARLNHELNRLPDRYRVPVVLCELEGIPRREAARMLGIPEGTLSSRLAQARRLLGRRLARHGTVAVTVLLAARMASASLSPTLRVLTAKAALRAGTVPAHVLALTEGVMKAMLITRLKITVCAAGLMLLVGVGASGWSYQATAQQPRPGNAVGSRLLADELEALRLEIDALRKELRTTKERVKVLEDGASGQKRVLDFPSKEEAARSRLETEAARLYLQDKRDAFRGQIQQQILQEKPVNPLASAEDALKKLRANPADRQAAEVLEQALQQIKAGAGAKQDVRDGLKVPDKK